MADSLLDFDFQKLLFGAEPPNPVAGFLSPEQEKNFKDQQTSDMLFGALGGYGSQLNQGKGIASKLLGTIQGARQGRASTGNVYLDALKGQMALTKGMGDVQKTGLEIQKLGFENTKLSRAGQAQVNAYLSALNSGDVELANAILIDSEEAVKAVLGAKIPKAPTMTESTYLFGRALEDRGVRKDTPLYNEAMLKHSTATTPLDKAKYAQDFFTNVGSKYPTQKMSSIPSKSDISTSYLNNQQNNRQVGQQMPNQQTAQQYVPPTQIGIPSTGFVPAPDTETYTLGDYTIQPQQQQQQQQVVTPQGTSNQQVTPNVQVAPPQDTMSQQTTEPQSITREVVSPTETISMLDGQQEQYWVKPPNPNGTTVQEKYGVVGTRPMSEETKQKYANEKEPKLNQIKKGINSTNDLLLDVDALVNSKGFDTFFGRGSFITSPLSEDAINTQRLWNKILKGTALANLVNMKLESPNGATPFGQLNYSELKMVLDEIIALESGGSPEIARTMLADFKTKMTRDANEALNFSNKLYGTNSTKDFKYIYSPELIIDGEVIDALPGYVIKNALGSRGSGLSNQYWYSLQDDGTGKRTYKMIRNPKSKNSSKALTQEDVRTGNY
jgi:hypothetical protein